MCYTLGEAGKNPAGRNGAVVMRVNRQGCVAGWLRGVVCGLGVAAAVTAAHGQLVPGFYVLEGTQGVALSADGRFGGGTYETPTADFASRWTLGPGTSITRQDVQLPTPVELTSGVHSISADGSTLVGRLLPGNGVARPFRIGPDGVVQNLGTIGTYQRAQANAVNGDGSVVVGYASNPETFLEGRSWRWTQATGMQYLPNPIGGIDATAVDMTPDGSVIAGYAHTNTTKAMVWRNGMAEFLGTVPGRRSVRRTCTRSVMMATLWLARAMCLGAHMLCGGLATSQRCSSRMRSRQRRLPLRPTAMAL